MKRTYILTVFLLFCCGFLRAQTSKFRVAEFYLDQQDMAAQLENRNDGDGYLYAVIKVTSDNEDDDLSRFSFDFNNMRHIKEVRDGELWLFVQRNAKYVTIRREGYKTITNHPLGQTVQAGKTYRLRLSVQAPKVTQRILQFKVTPPGEKAVVKVKAEGSAEGFQLWGEVDEQGSTDRLLPTGVYLYEVSAPGFSTSQGKVTLADGQDIYVERVNLRSNSGLLEVTGSGDMVGASVYVDDRKVGTIPYKSGRMECREDYRLMVSKGELYKTYSTTFAIRQGETTTLSPVLVSNAAEVTLRVEGEAEIFLNGVSKGKGSWKGKLSAGAYDVECRLPQHVASSRQIVVKEGVPVTIDLDRPVPIEGSLYVRSTPSGARVFLDGKDLGVTTPYKVDHVLVGEHSVKVMSDGYKAEEQKVVVKQGEITQLDARLNKTSQASQTAVSDGKGKVYSVNGVTFTMKFVEAGTFQMGSTTGESDEQPVHSVTLTKDYYIGETEVTQALWKAVTGLSPTSGGSSWSRVCGKGDDYPAYDISYEDVQSFLTKLNSLTGGNFRMPTEAEWEFAARGGTKSKGYTYSGSNTIGDVAWYTKNTFSRVHAVKTKSANELGIYDMSGNVNEWCSDWKRSYSSSAQTDPTGPATGTDRVFRGGGKGSSATLCRSACRRSITPSFRSDNLGFRLASPSSFRGQE